MGLLKRVILKKIKNLYLYFTDVEYRKKYSAELELARLSKIRRYSQGVTNILGKDLNFVDSSSFCFIYKEVFIKEIYNFKTKKNNPYIIDAGANIGLSVIYFKRLYPDSTIIAFEPDPIVFNVLSYNIQSFEFSNVNLINKALWISETELEFYSEGADAGRLIGGEKNIKRTKVLTESLRKYLNKEVDFLKIDIEGSETKVLEVCRDLLFHVERIFVEYHSFVENKQELSNLIGILESAGFRTYISSPFDNNKNPFINISNYLGMDNLLNIYGYR